MKEVLQNIKQIEKWSERTVNIPFHYILFLIALFLMWKPNYIVMLDVKGWLPDPLYKFTLNFVNEIYSHLILIIIVLFILTIVLICLSEYTSIFNKLLPKDKKFTDNTILSWNQYSFIRKVMKLMINLLSIFWIYYFLINITFKDIYASNFFNYVKPHENELITSGYITELNLSLMNMLFWLNIIVTIYLVIRALFQIRTPNHKLHIEYGDFDGKLGNRYINLNMFVAKLDEKTTRIAILKDMHMRTPMFYLVKQQFYRDDFERMGVNSLLNNKKHYKIINTSANLDEIIYHFEFLKEEYQK